MNNRNLGAGPSAVSLLSPGSRLRDEEQPDSISSKYSLPIDPHQWGTALHGDTPEPDDELHNPDPKRDRTWDQGGTLFTSRGIVNLGCLAFLGTTLLMLFAGYPILSFVLKKVPAITAAFNVGGINATGQIPVMAGRFALVDADTPKEAYTKASFQTPGDSWELVFSDEFNTEGRSFYPGDDPYWEAADLHYWQTNDLEWYDPSAVTTKGGALKLTLSKVDPVLNHNLTYRSGMIQSWNKFCFTGALVEVSVILPGANNVAGLWPAVWTMGNLGRAGYGASLDGLWPYSYDSCDVGTLPNQTYPGTLTPLAAVENGDPQNNNMLSYLPGQRLSACTCPGESHPGPVRADGSYVGRASPEIDIFEATVSAGFGQVSQSAQWAPFNAEYHWANTSANLVIPNTTETALNTYIGGAFQQTTSGLSTTDQACYELASACYATYGIEYQPGDNSYISWVNNGTVAWSMLGAGMGADTATEISARLVSREPMYIIANLGFSENFGGIDFDQLTLPATMSIDYIRVYQPSGNKNIGCDPPDYPTAAYINAYPDAYTNANYTGWNKGVGGVGGYGQPEPKNKKSAAGC